MDPSQLRADMTMPEIIVLMVSEIQRIESLDKPTAEQECEVEDMRKNLGEFIQHVDQQIGETYG